MSPDHVVWYSKYSSESMIFNKGWPKNAKLVPLEGIFILKRGAGSTVTPGQLPGSACVILCTLDHNDTAKLMFHFDILIEI